MNWNLVEQWADGIPLFKENDPKEPEWKSTPVIKADLSRDGYGIVHIKNEAAPQNPTGTIKDRAAWELATLYRDFARGINLRNKARKINGNIARMPIPRLSIITAGNVGRALSNVFKRFNLPPPKVLFDVHAPLKKGSSLNALYADVYSTDLSKQALTTQDIQRLTNNVNGMEITSFIAIEPNAIFYDWHVHEVFNQEPDEIYVPYGSGRLMENYLTWQFRTQRNAAQKRPDPRLKKSLQKRPDKIISIDICGAAPELQTSSIADKLTSAFNPFVLFKDQDIAGLKAFGITGSETGIYKVSEERIQEAYELMSKLCPAEPSAAVGLALYMDRYKSGLVNPRDKIMIINTGKGI